MLFAVRRFSRAAVAAVALAILVTTVGMATPAGALSPTATSPANGATVQPPSDIRVTYDSPLEESDSTISVMNGNGVVVGGSTSVQNQLTSGTIVFTPASTLTEAGSPYTVTVHAESLLETHDFDFFFSVDTTAPDAPTIAAVTNPVNATNATTVVVSGGAEEDSTVTVTIDDQDNESTAPVSVQVASDGPYEATLNVSSLDDGTLDVTATAMDEADNVSAGTATQTTKDSSVPSAPTVTIVDDPIDAANQGMVEITGGSGEEGLTIDVSVDDELGSPSVDATTSTGTDGSWTVHVDLSSLVDGQITAAATATDAVGNVSEEGSDTATKELGAPGLVSTTPTGGSSVQSVPEVTATYSEPLGTNASTITVSDNTDVTVAGTRSFRDDDRTIVFTPSAELPDAGSPYTATLAVEDAAGNPEDPPTVFSFDVDTTAPASPTITSATDPVNAANQAMFDVGGDAEPGTTVEVAVTDEADNTVTGTTEAASPWSLTLDVTQLADGILTVTATATDPAGNTSGASETLEVIKDTLSPEAPAITSATDPVHVGNQGMFEVQGEAEAGTTVEVTVTDEADNTVTGTTEATSPWSLTLDVTQLADGILTVTATATDPAGNTSGVSEAVEVTKLDEVTFTSRSFAVGGDFLPVAGDFNGDGNHDIFWYRAGTGADYLWLSNGDETFTPTRFAVGGDFLPVAGDFNGDGNHDIFWYRAGTGADYLWLSNGDETFTPTRFAVGGDFLPVAGDFNGDGKDDIFWVHPGTAADFVWFGNSDGSFTSARIHDNASYFPLVGDFNGDGYDDFIRYGPGTAPDSMHIQRIGFRNLTVNGVYAGAPIGDFDGNGRDDVFWYAKGAGADDLWLSV